MGAWRSVVSPSPVPRAVGPHQQGAANLDHGVRLHQKLCQNELPGVPGQHGGHQHGDQLGCVVREGGQHGGGECPADKGSTGLTVERTLQGTSSPQIRPLIADGAESARPGHHHLGTIGATLPPCPCPRSCRAVSAGVSRQLSSNHNQ